LSENDIGGVINRRNGFGATVSGQRFTQTFSEKACSALTPNF